MRIGILSDTHDQIARTRAAVRLLVDSGARTLIHCGDITIPEVVYEMAPLPSHFVFGNCDFDLPELRAAIQAIDGTCLEKGGLIELGGCRLAVTHGDSHRELAGLTARRPDYLFAGHTHKAADVVREGTRFINPGALHRASRWTVGVLDLDSGRFEHLVVGSSPMGA
ncbi:MAG: metallophosphoesterase family protein [Isosphaeraceae bacterium]